MKAALFIFGITTTFFLANKNKIMPAEQNKTVSAVYIDSVLEAGRVEMIKNKFYNL